MSRSYETWTAIGESVRGAAHIRGGLPNQDAVNCQMGNGAPPVAIAVADGHGSPRCIRSSDGAAIAVRVAVDTAIGFFKDTHDLPLSAIKDVFLHRFPAAVLRAWQNAVCEHLTIMPFSIAELSATNDARPGEYTHTHAPEQPDFYAYGTTLLLVLAGEGFIFYFQLGDGDILTMQDKHNEVKRPLVKDLALIANETTSLCMPNAVKFVRTKFDATRDTPPQLIMISTDGYYNSYSSEPSFSQVAADLLDFINSNGIDYVENNLADWLNEVSLQGSGDDVSLALLVRDVSPSKTVSTNSLNISNLK